MIRRNIREEAVTVYSLCSEWYVCNPMPWQLPNPTEEFAPHTNDPQRSVSVLFLHRSQAFEEVRASIKFDCNLHQCDAGCGLFMGVLILVRVTLRTRRASLREEGLRSLSLPVRIPGSGAGHPQATPVH